MMRLDAARVRAFKDDRGYATVASAGIIACLSALLLAVAGVVVHVSSRHEAQVAADLAAVAGTFALARGGEADACGQAAQVAELNGAAMVNCEILDRDVRVYVAVRHIETGARAGPP